jgi:hypothetical protein
VANWPFAERWRLTDGHAWTLAKEEGGGRGASDPVGVERGGGGERQRSDCRPF